ncbi:MAG: SDR family NAD(P)-dependent oxidoreductase [Paracoccaceae bacterium]
MADRLGGKTAIITGASTSVGAAIARRFASAGAAVMLADADEPALSTLTGELPSGKARHFACRLDEKLSVANLIAATQDSFGRIDILVNANRHSTSAPFLDLTFEEFDDAHRGNLRSVFSLAQAVARRMIQQRERDTTFRGAMVNITSIAARRAVPELIAYSVACAGLDQLTRSMAASLAGAGIRVNAVAVGSVMTETLRSALKERAETREEITRATPLGRIGDADEAANAVLYLASSEASFVTGQILAVDGGRTVLDPMASPVR